MKKRIKIGLLLCSLFLVPGCMKTQKSLSKNDSEKITGLSRNEGAKELSSIYDEYLHAWAKEQPMSVKRKFSSSTKQGRFISASETQQNSQSIFYDKNNFFMNQEEEIITKEEAVNSTYTIEKKDGKLYFLEGGANKEPITTKLKAESTFYQDLEGMIQINVLERLLVKDKLNSKIEKIEKKDNISYKFETIDNEGYKEKVTIQHAPKKIAVRAQRDGMDVLTTVELFSAKPLKKETAAKGEEILISGTKADLYATDSNDFCERKLGINTHGFNKTSVLYMEERFALLQKFSDVFPDLEITLEIGAVPDQDRLISFDSRNDWKESKTIQTDDFIGKLYVDKKKQRIIFESEKGDLPVNGQILSEKPIQETDQLIFEKILNGIYLY